MSLPLDRWCNAVLVWLIRRCEDEAARGALLERIRRPLTRRSIGRGAPTPVPKPARMTREQQAAAFNAYASTTV